MRTEADVEVAIEMAQRLVSHVHDAEDINRIIARITRMPPECRAFDPSRAVFAPERAASILTLQAADAGDKTAAKALIMLALATIKRGEALPDGLREFAVACWGGQQPVPRGRKPDFARNFWIRFAVSQVMRHGFNKDRGAAMRDKNTTQSACSIVCEALRRVGRHLDESTILKLVEDL